MLADLQKKFITAVREEKDELLLPEMKDNGFPPEKLINVYRNNTFVVQGKAIELTYPALANIIGERFPSLAFEFVRSNPSVTGNLDDYGYDFPDFLRKLEFFVDKPHLAELADFEKLYQQSGIAAPGKIFDAVAFTSLKPEQLMEVKMVFSPHVRLMAAKYPVVRIWEYNLEKKAEEVDVEEGGSNILITRPELKPDIYLLGGAEFIFLLQLEAGSTLYDAFEAAINTDENFNLEQAIKNNILRGVFESFSR